MNATVTERAVVPEKVAPKDFARVLQVERLSKIVLPLALPAPSLLEEVILATARISIATTTASAANSRLAIVARNLRRARSARRYPLCAMPCEA